MIEQPIAQSLLVIYTQQLDECREFYGTLGLDLAREQHGNGPVHYAVKLGGGLMLELYPAASPDRATGRLRISLTVPANDNVPEGDTTLKAPDGRVVDVTAEAPVAG